jgi:hypothetical protein
MKNTIALTILLLCCSVACAQTVARKDSTIEVAFRYDQIVVVVYDLPQCFQQREEYVIPYESYHRKMTAQTMMQVENLVNGIFHSELNGVDKQVIINEIKSRVNAINYTQE